MVGADLAQLPTMPVPARVDHATPRPVPSLGSLEWAVVALAEQDSLGSLRYPGRLTTALAAVFGAPSHYRLANDRLEALRRLAVHAWHQGFAIPAAEIRAFFGAGLTPDQLELVVASINRGRLKRNRRT